MKTFQEFITEVEAYSNIRSLAPYKVMPPLKTKDGKPNPAPQRFLINPKTGLGPTAQLAPPKVNTPIDTRTPGRKLYDLIKAKEKKNT